MNVASVRYEDSEREAQHTKPDRRMRRVGAASLAAVVALIILLQFRRRAQFIVDLESRPVAHSLHCIAFCQKHPRQMAERSSAMVASQQPFDDAKWDSDLHGSSDMPSLHARAGCGRMAQSHLLCKSKKPLYGGDTAVQPDCGQPKDVAESTCAADRGH